jgi:hypothetical protein
MILPLLISSTVMTLYKEQETYVLASDLTSWTNFSMIGLETDISSSLICDKEHTSLSVLDEPWT